MSLSSHLEWAACALVLCLPLWGQGSGDLEVAFLNQTGAAVDGLRLSFDADLDPTTPVELTSGAGSYVPFATAPVLLDPRTVLFEGGTLNHGAVFPSGAAGEQLRFLAAESGRSLRIVGAAWRIAGVDAYGLHVFRLPNHTGSSSDGLEVELLDHAGQSVTVLDAAPSPDPWTPLACTVTCTPLGGQRWRFDLGCAVPGDGATTPLLQMTLPGTGAVGGMRARWSSGGVKTGSAEALRLVPSGTAPALGVRLAANQPVDSVDPVSSDPLGTIVGYGGSTIDLCGTALGPGVALVGGHLVLTSSDTGGQDLQVASATWRTAAPHPLIPDALYYTFDEGASGSPSLTSNMALPAAPNPQASVAGFTTDGTGQFGHGLTRRGSAPDFHVATGYATDLGAGGWTVACWVDLRGSSNPTGTQYLFADETAGNFRAHLNGSNFVGNATLRGSGFSAVTIPGGADPASPHTLTWVYDPAVPEIRGYLDGNLVNTVAVGSLNLSAGGDLWIGRHQSYGGVLAQGTVLDEFRLYRRVVSAAEVAEIADAFVLASGMPPVFETNDPEAALLINGREGLPCCPAFVTSPAGAFLDLELQSANWGYPFDVLVTPAPLVPGDAGGLVLWDGQVLNVDPFSPLTTLAFGGFLLPFVPALLTAAPTAPAELTWQMVVAAPAEPSGFAVSGATQLTVGPPVPVPNIVFEARGPNSYNSDANLPFWRLTHHAMSLPITRLVIDVAQSTNPAHSSMRFDLDQAMAVPGTILYGNGAPPCNGTYRNGSDLAVGLIYDAQSTYIGFTGSSCTGGNCGFIASEPYGTTAHDFRRMEFRFTPGLFLGTTFEWDMDTDGGPGVSGDDMAGLYVTIELMGGTILSGELEVDPTRPQTSILLR